MGLFGGTKSGGDKKAKYYEASQWTLVRRRFAKHKMALWMIHLVFILYFLCLNCEFFSPYKPSSRHAEWVNVPPQMLRFGFVEGFAWPRFYVHPFQADKNPVTLARRYAVDYDTRVPIRLFVKSWTYRYFGLVKTDWHLFGVDEVQGRTCFLTGTDGLGQDMLSRIFHGGRISLLLGLTGVLLTFFLGILTGGISGFYGGKIDMFIQRLAEIFQTVPKIPIWLALAAAIPKDWTSLQVYFGMTLILACMGWTNLCRVVRGKLLALREEDYARAALLAGASEGRIIFGHLVPNFTSHIIASLTLSIPGMILAETSLSFLGLGLRPPIVSWGVLLQQASNVNVVVNQPWLLLPAWMVVLAVLALNFAGDGLRDAADPYAT